MGELTVVGIGPGAPDRLTGEALEALRGAELVVGYPLYLELIAPLTAGRETWATPMRKETERCRFALSEAEKGRAVVLVCSGDAGVYGLAGPVLELLPAYPGVTVRVVAGVTAALSGAALLGAATVTISDTAARTLFAPAELPVGILTALLGAPFFLYLLRREL